MEDYKKLYEEALSRAKEWSEGKYGHGVDDTPKDIAEWLFPELAETESERIRKWCISHFRECFRVSKGNVEYQEYLNNKVIPWLEKQGEQKPVPKFKIGDTMRTLQEVKDGWIEGMPFVVSIDNEYYYCNSEKIAIKDQDEYEYPPMNRKHDVCDSCDEQKPAWSEENEKKDKEYNPTEWNSEDDVNLNAILKLVEYDYLRDWLKTHIICSKPVRNQLNEEMISAVNQILEEVQEKNRWNCVYLDDKVVLYSGIRDWLKTICHETEWSEEDKKAIDNIEWALIDKRVKEGNTEKYRKELEWLKSLKERV